MTAAIQTINLTKRFTVPKRYRDLLLHPFKRTESTVLQEVNIQVEPGELFGLLGPNGAGKTTLVKILCNMVLPTSGQALLFGHDVTRDEKAIKKMIGYVVSEERSFFWRLSGRQNLDFFAALNNMPPREAEKRIDDIVEMVGLGEAIDKTFRTYSTGMKQKLAIARGMLADPQILFLDEPTRALDPIATKRVRSFIRDIIVGQAGKTVVLATNNMHEADTMCDRVAIIDKGRVKVCDTVRHIKTRMHDCRRFTISIGGTVDSINRKLTHSRLNRTCWIVLPDPASDGDTRITIELDRNGENPSAIIKDLLAVDLEVKAFYPEEYSLDEIFSKIIV